MAGEKTPEEIRRLKEKGIVDVGISYICIAGFGKSRKHKRWDLEEPTEDSDDKTDEGS